MYGFGCIDVGGHINLETVERPRSLDYMIWVWLEKVVDELESLRNVARLETGEKSEGPCWRERSKAFLIFFRRIFKNKKLFVFRLEVANFAR